MPNYWVIAPVESNLECFDRVWKFNLDNGFISIGWGDLGDISSLGEDKLRKRIERAYPNTSPNVTGESPNARRMYLRMLWDFHHSIEKGDVVIARRGTKRLLAVGTVTRTAYYKEGKNPDMPDEYGHPNHLDAKWWETPRDKTFDSIVFGIQTVCRLPEEKFRALVQDETPIAGTPQVTEEGVQDKAEFVLERYLEDFIVSNFDTIFKGKLVLFSDPNEGVVGQQFQTGVGPIDILAVEKDSNAFVVIELKKGRESDKVVGQTLRYMGWVTESLCEPGQDVKGIVVCREADERLSYAVRMVKNVSIKYYRIDFRLEDGSR